MIGPGTVPFAAVAGLAGALCAAPLAKIAWLLADDHPVPPPGRSSWFAPVCAAAAVSLTARLGLTPELVECAVFAASLAVATLVDLGSRRIPDVCVGTAVLARLAFIAWLAFAGERGEASRQLVASLATAVAVIALLCVLDLVAFRLLHMPGMGGGDVKLLAVAGLYFGWRRWFALALVACLVGIVCGMCLALRHPGSRAAEQTFPFAPAIAFACWLVVMVGGGGATGLW